MTQLFPSGEAVRNGAIFLKLVVNPGKPCNFMLPSLYVGINSCSNGILYERQGKLYNRGSSSKGFSNFAYIPIDAACQTLG
jgi:hypothetical protein